MRIRVPFVLLQLCLAGSLAAQKAPAPAPPKIEITSTGVAISGVTPKSDVAWMEIAREFSDMSLRLVRISDVATDDDADGAVQIDVDKPVDPQSVWIAVDLTNGAFAIAAPPDFPLHLTELPPSAVRPGAIGNADALDLSNHQVELLLARPGVGAWAGTFGDGGPSDVDGVADGRLRVALDCLAPLGDSPASHATVLKPGDAVVVVDSTSLDVYAVRVAVPR
jgi:hypothetical protein